jgi:hypothetical protein
MSELGSRDHRNALFCLMSALSTGDGVQFEVLGSAGVNLGLSCSSGSDQLRGRAGQVLAEGQRHPEGMRQRRGATSVLFPVRCIRTLGVRLYQAGRNTTDAVAGGDDRHD